MITVQTFVKGLLMALIAIAVTFFSQTPIQWGLLVVTAIATVLAYLGKNLIFVFAESETGPNELTWLNLLSALLVAISTGITESVALLIIEGHIVWLTLGKVVLGVTFSYLGSTFFSSPKSQSKKLIS